MAVVKQTERSPGPQLGELTLCTIVLLALAVGGIAVLALSDTLWSLILALAATAAGTMAVATGVRALVADEDGQSSPEPLRGRILALGSAAAVMLALAAMPLSIDAETQNSQPAATAAGAEQTLRDFLSVAVLQDNPYAACQFVTPAEQQRIGGLAGPGQPCRYALTAMPPRLGAVTSPRALRNLHLQAVMRATQARLTVSGADAPRMSFTLRRATPSEAAAFDAPSTGWRIASGATALLADNPTAVTHPASQPG